MDVQLTAINCYYRIHYILSGVILSCSAKDALDATWF